MTTPRSTHNKKFFQLVSALSPFDAVSNYTREIDQLMTKAGFETMIFAHHLAPELESQTIRPLHEAEQFLGSPLTIWGYQYSVHDAATEYFYQIAGPKAFFYHNITPHHFFAGYDPAISQICKTGRDLLPEIASHTDLAITMSEYSRQELLQAGFNSDQTHAVPFITELPNRPIKSAPKLDQPFLNLLFVGKVAPHKGLHHLIKGFYLYQKYFQPTSKLQIIGALGHDEYTAQIKGLITNLGLGEAINLAGRVSDKKLVQHYLAADCFVTMSEHEGFCAPIVEAMQIGLPILAMDGGAIAETIGHAGVVLETSDPTLLAITLDFLGKDQSLKHKLAVSRREQLSKLDPATSRQKVKDLLLSLV